MFEGSDFGKEFTLLPLSKKEFSRALGQYQEFYGVGRGWEDSALEAAHQSPFFMRVIFEVAQKRGDEFIILDSVEFFEKYFDQAISRLEHPEAARLILSSTARALFESGSERILHDELVLRTGAAYSREVLDELIEYQILEWATTDAGMSVSFYFSLLRDYIIAFHSERWQAADRAVFMKALEELMDQTVNQEAVAFFYRYASPDKQRLMDADARLRAGRILKTYLMILSTDLRPIQNRFVPYTNARIGYVSTFRPGSADLGFCHFREISDIEDEILLIPTVGKRLFDSNLPHLYGARGLVGMVGISGDDTTEWTINRAIGLQLQELVDQGRLDESSEIEMVAETLAGVASRSTCGYSGEPHPARLRKRPPQYPRQKPDLFPLRTQDVRRWLKYWLLYSHFREHRLAEKLRNGEIPIIEGKDGTRGYSSNLNYEEMKELEGRIEPLLDLDEAEIRKIIGPTKKIILREAYQRTNEALEALAAAGIEVIEDEYFPEPEILSRSGLKAEPVCAFLEKAFSKALESFISIVKENFPTLYKHFPSVRWQPLTLVLAVEIERTGRGWSDISIYVCEGSNPLTQVIARPAEEVNIIINRDPSWRFEVEVGGRRYVRHETKATREVLGQRSVSLNRVLSPGSQYFGRLGNSMSSWAGPSTRSVIRTIVYDWLRAELHVVFAELCVKYGTELESRNWTFFSRTH